MMRAIQVVQSLAIYDGREQIGDVAELANGQFAAIAPTGKRIGRYEQRRDAELAIMMLKHRRAG